MLRYCVPIALGYLGLVMAILSMTDPTYVKTSFWLSVAAAALLVLIALAGSLGALGRRTTNLVRETREAASQEDAPPTKSPPPIVTERDD